MMKVLYVGMDVHKDSIDIALADADPTVEARVFGRIGGDMASLDKAIRKLKSTGCEPCFAYEAGPGGYHVYRHLQSHGLACIVVAPSLIPKRAGDKIKTDRRDSLMLARLFRAGELTSVHVPDEEDEAMRDLIRARNDAKSAETKARQRLLAFLLRYGIRYPGKTHWRPAHLRWLAELTMPLPVQQIVLQEYVDAVKEATNRVARLLNQICEVLPQWKRAPVVKAYQALRGVALLTAVSVAAEIGDMNRFESPKHLMAYLGLVPSEHSSGGTIRRGGITKTGNNLVRRLLVESAWSYRLVARKTSHLLKRQQDLTPEICDIAWKAQLRLCGRYRKLFSKGKAKQVIVTTIARELSGFMWAIGRQSEHRAA